MEACNAMESIRIGLASPEKIREWSFGEVKKPETINYRTLKPEKDGLFCERIFGPQKDWECHCGKYRRIRYKGKVCEKCGVEITRAKVRRERMGHIELATPVSHIWYFKGNPSRIAYMLDISLRALEKVLYFASYIVTDPGDTPLEKKQLLSETEYRDYREKYEDDFEAGMGAEYIRKLLEEIDLENLSVQLKEELDKAQGQKKAKILKRLEIVEAFRVSGNRPEWMVMTVVPVIPPDIRPMVTLDGGRFATSDLNDLYRRVINRNNRLKRLLELDAPDIIIRNEKRMLQEAVDALIDNGRRGRPVTGPNNRPLKSLSDMLKGKQGRFRQNLLGKRVDYSGRSVIVVGPELKMYQCGLPKEMALELFKPFVLKRLVETELANNPKAAKKKVERQSPEVWDALEEVIKGHPVLLNRAPTLHRLGIQAFEPVLVEGRALKLHPLVCTAYNADFDGDQMAVHVPLSAEAQAEARFLMLAAHNLLKPSDGRPVAVPTQDMVLGSYYLTDLRENEPGAGKIFRDCDEAIMAYQEKVVGLHAPIKVRITKTVNEETYTRLVDTTVGRILFNRPIPQDLGYVDRNDPEKVCDFEISFLVKKKQLGQIIDACIRAHGVKETSVVLDEIKAQGFKYSTQGAITVSVYDAVIPEEKKEYVAEAEAKIEKLERDYNRGLYSKSEKSQKLISIWNNCTDQVTKAIQQHFDSRNPISMMVDSGARGNLDQMRQLAGMRGLISNTAGSTIEVPIRANYREGLNVMEYFISSRGARKGLADTALRTADSGYLTRRLVDVSQDVIIREVDCGTTNGIEVVSIREGKEIIEPLAERLTGRVLAKSIVNAETGEVLFAADGEIMKEETAAAIAKLYEDEDRQVTLSPENPIIRSVLTCESKEGVCSKCYGHNLANKEPAAVGESVGIIAAQSIGEPGTQLTMRTFHLGGIANAGDITQGLPRVEELFEGRKPKKLAVLSELAGEVSFVQEGKKEFIVVRNNETGEEGKYLREFESKACVTTGQHVEKGQSLTEGSINPHDKLRIENEKAVYDYLIAEVQKVYRMQGVDINDKHIEVIVRQMLKKVKVEEPGYTEFLPGSQVERSDFNNANKWIDRLVASVKEQAADGESVVLDGRTYLLEGENVYELREGNSFNEETGEVIPEKQAVVKATYTPVLLGITKASLATESFLSAASFQETTRVLTDAAIKGKIDPLVGLKENVIIGKLVPAGTGMAMYNQVKIAETQTEEEPQEISEEEAL
ncbi:MAG: DNA-directed RNA polymerase subunit beta' [Oscillospiraceae bacterium]|nr:DNA-directed RNA polymerase subunit beta' [Oscillospiraceae bacterium]